MRRQRCVPQRRLVPQGMSVPLRPLTCTKEI